MAMRHRLVAVALTLAASLGCGPPLARLSDQRAFDQALCAAQQDSRDPDEALAYVRDRIDEEARPRLHLYAMPPEELRRSLGEAGARLAEQAVVVRAVAAIDDVQIDDFELRVLLMGPDGAVAAIPPHVERLAELTGETIPPDEVEVIAGGRRFQSRRFRERPLLGVVAGVLEASTLFMVPVTEFTGHTRREPGDVIVTEPTPAQIAASAPAASMLAEESARLSHVRYDQGREVASVWLWPRATSGPLRVVVEWSYLAHGCASKRPAMRRPVGSSTSEVVRVVELPLPDGPDLESRLFAVFGDRMQRLGPRAAAPADSWGP